MGWYFNCEFPAPENITFIRLCWRILKLQEQDIAELSVLLYSNGLSDSQISEVIEHLFGWSYSPARISPMVSYVKEDLVRWCNRPVDRYYPIVYIDALFISSRDETGQVRDNPYYKY